jgi:low affinity Fe/Cu permease
MRAHLPISALGASSAAGDWFGRLASKTAHLTGKPATFIAATAIVLIWALTGPVFGYSDSWQLVINTGTTIITFLMVFLIQNTQMRDTLALQLKLDELILATKEARNELAGIEVTLGSRGVFVTCSARWRCSKASFMQKGSASHFGLRTNCASVF